MCHTTTTNGWFPQGSHRRAGHSASDGRRANPRSRRAGLHPGLPTLALRALLPLVAELAGQTRRCRWCSPAPPRPLGVRLLHLCLAFRSLWTIFQDSRRPRHACSIREPVHRALRMLWAFSESGRGPCHTVAKDDEHRPGGRFGEARRWRLRAECGRCAAALGRPPHQHRGGGEGRARLSAFRAQTLPPYKYAQRCDINTVPREPPSRVCAPLPLPRLDPPADPQQPPRTDPLPSEGVGGDGATPQPRDTGIAGLGGSATAADARTTSRPSACH